jgi:CopG family nickel-responsive transcriptional regulator
VKSARTRFGVSIDSELATRFDAKIAAKGYRTRSKALEDLIRSWLIEQELTLQNKEAVGVIILVYDHQTAATTGALLHIQHHHTSKVVSTTHIHLNEYSCMEVIIVRAHASEIRHIADELAPVRGVKQVKLTITTDDALTPPQGTHARPHHASEE